MCTRYQICNPFVGTDGYRCFACAPHNAIGLKLQFERCGDSVRTYWQPSADYQGYNQIVHGGIQATLLDEVASWTIFVLLGVAALTQKIDIDYRKALPTEAGAITAVGSVVSQTARHITVMSRLYIRDTVYTNAVVEFRVVPKRHASQIFNFPDPEKFHVHETSSLNQ